MSILHSISRLVLSSLSIVLCLILSFHSSPSLYIPCLLPLSYFSIFTFSRSPSISLVDFLFFRFRPRLFSPLSISAFYFSLVSSLFRVFHLTYSTPIRVQLLSQFSLFLTLTHRVFILLFLIAFSPYFTLY